MSDSNRNAYGNRTRGDAVGHVTKSFSTRPTTSANVAVDGVSFAGNFVAVDLGNSYLCSLHVILSIAYTAAETATTFTTDESMVPAAYIPKTKIRNFTAYGRLGGEGMTQCVARLQTDGTLDFSTISPAGAVAPIVGDEDYTWVVTK